MNNEKEITLIDLVRILKDILFSGCLFGLKTTNKIMEDCNLIDLNEECKIATIVYSDRSKSAMVKVALENVTSIEFELPYDYAGTKTRAFIVR